MPEQRFAVSPVLDLGRGEYHRGQTCRNGSGNDRPPGYRPPPCEIGRTPGQHNGQAGHRNIHVPVRPRLSAHLHQSDYRRQRHQIPDPARRQVGSVAERSQRQRRDDRQGQPGSRHRPPREAGRVRIKNGQPRRPNRFEAVDAAGDESILDPQPQGQPADLLDGPTGVLHQVRGDSREGCQRKERNLLAHGRPRKPAQRPGVQQQQQERQGDDHRLRHQSQPEQQQDDAITSPPRPLGIPHVSPQRQKPEESAQNVFALSHPRDRFHVQRMKGEQEGDPRARPAVVGRTPQECEQQHRR